MKYLITLFLLSWQTLLAQQQISGVVLNGIDGSKLIAASVFINNSTKGTITNSEGQFTLSGLAETNFELVVSYVGFTTVSINIRLQNIKDSLTINLYPRPQDLPGVSLTAPDKDGWNKWGKLFTEYFIGLSEFANHCKIDNPEVILFFRDKKTSIIHAYSNGAIHIANNDLGYNIKFQLEDFTYKPYSSQMSYFGYAVYENIAINSKNKKDRCDKNRRHAYEGSMLHFMRALYRDSLKAQDFKVREKIKLTSSDSLYINIYQNKTQPRFVRTDSKLYSIKYVYSNFSKKKPDYLYLIDTAEFPFNKIVTYDENKKQKKLFFENYLEVTYKNEVEISEMLLLSDEPLIIEESGFYYNPINLLTSGFWGTQRVGDALPSDYIYK